MRNLVLASSSSVHGYGYLEYLKPTLIELYKNVDEVLFIPYAQPSGMSYEEYTAYVTPFFNSIGKKVVGIHEFKSPKEALINSNAIYTGGGNTFLLVKTLYEYDLWSVLKARIEEGIPYLGTSAGSNICGVSMQTTNDMPIVLPSSYTTLGVLPFNLNVHYIEPDKNSKHKGETRATRIKEYQTINDISVLGLREGSWLHITDIIKLGGELDAIWFDTNKTQKIIKPNSVLN